MTGRSACSTAVCKIQAKATHHSPTISEKRPRQEAVLPPASNFSSHEPRIFLQSCKTNLEQKAWVRGYSITATSQSRSCPLEAVSPTHLETIYCSSGPLHPVRKTAAVRSPSPLHSSVHNTYYKASTQTHRCLPACVTRKAF